MSSFVKKNLLPRSPSQFEQKPIERISEFAFKGLIIITLLFGSGTAYADPGDVFPTYLHQPIDTQWYTYNRVYFGIDKELNLFKASPAKSGSRVTHTDIARLPDKPDLIRHFPMRSGDMVLASFHNQKRVLMMTFDFDGRMAFRNDYKFPYRVLDMDARIGSDGSPEALFLVKEKSNYQIISWINGNYSAIFVSSEPVISFFLQSSLNKIHILKKTGATFSWLMKDEKEIVELQLPDYFSQGRFFAWKGSVFLMALTAEGSLRLFKTNGRTISALTIFSDVRLVNSDAVIPLILQDNFYFLFPSAKLAAIYKLRIFDLENGRADSKLEVRKIAFKGKIHPFISEANVLQLLIENEAGHLNFESWQPDSPVLSAFSFTVTDTSNPGLFVNWQSNGTFQYRYALNREANIPLLAIDNLLSINSLRYENLKDGKYFLHIQPIDLQGKEGQIYHVPLAWQYLPSEPKIEILNQIATDLVSAGNLKFVINNYYPAEYFAEIDTFPVSDPVTPLAITGQTGEISARIPAGRYYLHVRARDPGSGNFGQTCHKLLYIDSKDIDLEKSLAESNKIMSDAEYYLRKVKENQYNPTEQRKWIQKLEQLREETKKAAER
ncbi:MAG: hypothetical protein KDK41_14955 [Leptospiraceae bacterium]|nr:hypothetical protein [Leptospiraceae bacterium]